ncbi:hypothetical protein SAMN04488090_0665 [Siphonobacter aquaeclarae]|uniref:T9SS type A sorting domain-containing protein n=1 Tax=Siphonobacter aquaeclarae TaxID=563176 RepID=A0A1G9IYD1_9BACT|nr:hypothetical protein SAMN04488090_0665 [Siphonobacter aquaeclarae]
MERIHPTPLTRERTGSFSTRKRKHFLLSQLRIFLYVILLLSSGALSAQQIQSGSGAPAANFEVANGPQTFTVTVLGGPASSGALTVTLPTGYVFDSGSAIGSGGLTVSQTSASGNTASLNLSGIPGTGSSASFTFTARATCAAIGVSGNQASYVFTPAGGSAQPEKLSNAFNLVNAKINITQLANAPATAGVVGDSYVRTYRINNNGFGSIDTLYVTDISGTGVEHVSHSVSATNNGATVTVDLLSTTTSGTNTTYLYRFIVSNTAQDNHLGQNEYFTFTQNLKIASCNNLNTSLNAWYGSSPNPTPCVPQNDTQTTALAINNAKQPNVQISAVLSAPATCRGVPVTQTIKVVNNGTATATDVLVRLYHTTDSPATDARSQIGYVPGSFQYKIGASGTYAAVPSGAASGVTLTNPVNYLTPSCLGSAAPNGLDVVIPALAPGQEIYFQYDELNCCYTECAGSTITGSFAKLKYSNPCGTEVVNNISSGGFVALRNSVFVSATLATDFPTDMIQGTSYTLKWQTVGADYPTSVYTNGSTVRYEITLAPGMVYNGGAITMLARDGSTATPASVTQTGNTLSISFVTGTGGFTTTNAHLKAVLSIPGITLDCSLRTAGAGNNVTTKLFYKGVSCSCEEQVACLDQPIALHCPSPCDAGMVNDNFTVVRRNYGAPDNANNGTANGASLSTNVHRNWVSRGDTLDFTFYGTVADAGSAVHHFKYGYAKFTIPNSTATQFTALSATVKITDATGTVTKVNLTNFPVSYTSSGSSGTAVVDYSIDKLITAGVSGYTEFVNTDKVTITLSLKVSNGIGAQLTSTVVSTDFYLSDAANPTGSVTADKWACDNFSGVYTLVGLTTYYSSRLFTGNECNTVTATGRAGSIVGDNVNTGGPGGDFYTDEYRQLGVPGNYNITVPAGYTLESITFTYYRGTTNYGQTSAFITNPSPDAVSGQTYTYNMRKQFVDQGGPWALPDEGFYVDFSAVLRPSCESVNNAPVTFTMQILPGTALNETLPAANFTPTSTSNFISLTKSNLVVNANSPIQTVNGNTVTWEIQVANTQPGTSPKVWMAENSGSTNGVTIQSIEPINAFGGTVSGAALSAVGGIYQLGTYGQESRYYRVTATFTNCGQDVLPLAVGYVCGNYPASIDAAACRNVTNLTVIPTDANLQVSLIGQPVPTYPDGTNDLCGELEYTAEVKNPAQGTAYDLTFTVKKPAGVAYIANSYQLSPTIQPATATFTAVGNDATYVSETATDLTFTIPASVVANLPYNAGYTIRYRVRTVACDFISGTKMTLQALGENGCGSAINGTAQQTQTIRIKGENPNPNVYTITSSVSGPVTCSSSPVTYTFSAKNEGPVATYAGETVRVTLEKPFTLGAVTGISNFTSGAAPTVTSDATSTTYVWTLPSGVAAGEIISFSAPLTTAGTPACGQFPVKELIAYTFTSTCAPSGPTCTGSLQAEGENEATVIDVTKPAYAISAFTGAASATGSNVVGTLTLTHTNTAYVSQNAVVSLFKDADGNGQYSSGDVLLGSQTFAVANTASQTFNYDIASSYKGNVCPIVAVVDLTCACADSLQYAYACNIPLPVSLASFTAAAEGRSSARLNWVTASELNNAFFEIQHSLNARDFETVGQVAGHGTTQQKQSYTFLNEGLDASHIHYYRLKQVDADGKFQYTKTVSVVLPGYGGLSLRVTPNPATGHTIRALVGYDDDQLATAAELELFTVSGRSLLVRRLNLTPGGNEVLLPADSYPAGTYLISLRHESLSQPITVRVVIR